MGLVTQQGAAEQISDRGSSSLRYGPGLFNHSDSILCHRAQVLHRAFENDYSGTSCHYSNNNKEKIIDFHLQHKSLCQ